MKDKLVGLRWAIDDLEKDIEWLTERNRDDDLLCRELSLAITNLEQGWLWLRRSYELLQAKQALKSGLEKVLAEDGQR